MKWHIIALQEAIEYLQHDSLTNHFHISHYAGCTVLSNQDTFDPDVRVSSVHIHDTKSRCGVQETLRENEPAYVDSSGRRIQTMSGRYAVMARSKSIVMFSAFDPPTRAATTRFGSTFSHANARLVDRYRSRNAVRSEQDRRQSMKRGDPYDHM